MVLIAEGYKFVITEECPEKRDEDATDDQVKAYDKWVKADEMTRSKKTAMKALLNTKMAEGSSIRDRVLKMMGLLNELEVLEALTDKESQVEMVVQTLPDTPIVEMKVEKASVSKLRGDKKKKKAHKVLAPGGAAVGVKKPKGK
ncbi:PREDICTED: uncharacterized protein LOC109219895 [Nicotiana attenuata]|uniref:uncharacterized protein LOC109219895 n=1 Tax=Nicotiana attenuata TaxID=49451 RepID=UPI0009047C46|nr:PREDICTED: uncharacterized protein LOC109219895 [Nicotiana attenuata]